MHVDRRTGRLFGRRPIAVAETRRKYDDSRRSSQDGSADPKRKESQAQPRCLGSLLRPAGYSTFWARATRDSLVRSRISRSSLLVPGWLLVLCFSAFGKHKLFGLRRYLRKRSVAMPATMATTWMASGIIGVVLLLAVACFLPLPGRNAGLISLPFTATSPTNLQASSYGWGGEGVSQQPDQDRSKNEGAAKVENGKASEDKSKSVRSGDQPETSSDQSKSKSKDTSSNKDESSSRNDSSKSKDSNSKNDPSQKQTTPTESKSSDKSQPDAKSSQNQKSPTIRPTKSRPRILPRIG